MAKTKLQTVADAERLAELARNVKTSAKPYTINDTIPNVGGTPLEKNERNVELARNEYTKAKPYDINSI